MNFPLYSRGMMIGRATIKATTIGDRISSDTSICRLMVRLLAATSLFTAERRGKKSVSMAEKTIPA